LDHFLKRLFDFVVASILLVIALPIFLIVAGLVAFTSRGPLFYRQKRVGRDGRLFEIFKFRTMRQDADRTGPSVTSADDDRITKIGRILRVTKLDEIPQLFNVIRGDMSLVGPRPQVPRFVEHFNPDLRELVLRVRPGITGPTALRFRNEEQMLANQPDRETYYIHTILPIKLEMDAEYVRSCSLYEDVRILFATAKLLAGGTRQRSAVHSEPHGA
jgi:lipopolysaccharide/colanic/teichoic acid biosynthesis glycosyltransferase